MDVPLKPQVIAGQLSELLADDAIITTDSTWPVTGFYTEVTAVDDPVTTYYMATGFARGDLGMQSSSETASGDVPQLDIAIRGRHGQSRPIRP